MLQSWSTFSVVASESASPAETVACAACSQVRFAPPLAANSPSKGSFSQA